MSGSGYWRRGYTILEALAGVTIIILAVVCTVTVYLTSVTAWKEGGVQITLQRQGSIAMEKMVRGVDGMNGIREATSVTTGTGTITYTIGSTNRRFYLNSDKVMYDPGTPSSDDDDFSIAENVRTSGLEFVRYPADVNNRIRDEVKIKLKMRGKVLDRNIDVDLSTKVQLRN